MTSTTCPTMLVKDVEMTMKAIMQDTYGTPDVLELRDIDRPVPGDGEVLVRVRAASLNALDWHVTTGTPYFIRPSAGLRRPKRHTPASTSPARSSRSVTR